MVAETDTAEQQAATVDAPQPDASAQQPVTAPDQQLPPDPVEATPETEPATSPETAAADAPDIAALLGDLSAEELQELGPVKDVLARSAESVRRTTEADGARLASQQRRQALVGDEATTALRLAFTVGADGEPKIDDEALGAGVNSIFTGSVDVAVRTVGLIVDDSVPKDFPMTREDAERFQGALTAFEKDPTGGAENLIREYVGISNRAAVAAAEGEMRTELTKDIRKEFEDAATVADRTRVETAQENERAPTRGVTGAPATGWATRAQIDKAHARDEITTDEYARLNMDGTYESLPYR